MMRAKYRSATEKAYEVLFLNQSNAIPINPKDIKLDNIIIKVFSMQEWANINNIDVSELTCKGVCEDGYTRFHKKENKKYAFVFYNEDIDSVERQRFTIAHEVGHIALEHNNLNSESNEKEANTFASQLLLPHCVLEELIKYGKGNANYLQKTFGLSKEATKISLQMVGKKMEKQAVAEYEDIIKEMFKNFINKEIKNTKQRFYDEDDEMDKVRDNWK